MEVSFIRVFLLHRRAVPAALVSVLCSLASSLSLLLASNGERAYHCRERGEREPWKRRICGLTIKDVSDGTWASPPPFKDRSAVTPEIRMRPGNFANGDCRYIRGESVVNNPWGDPFRKSGLLSAYRLQRTVCDPPRAVLTVKTMHFNFYA